MAEAQALEEARRRNPVKLGIWIGGFLVALMGLWIGNVEMKVYFAKNDLAGLNQRWKDAEGKFNSVTTQEALLAAVQGKTNALNYLRTNRFYWGSVLNALQYTVVTNIVVTHVWGVQTFEREPNRVVQGRTYPGTATLEKVKLFIAGKDYTAAEGYKNYEDALNHFDFFAKQMGGREGFTIEGAPGPKVPVALGSHEEYRAFTLTNQFPDLRREDR